MKSMISRVFSRGPRRSPLLPVHSAVSSELSASDIESYYLRVILDGLRRMLVPIDSIDVQVKRSGTTAEGMMSFSGYVRILKWDPVVTPVVLQNMPVIDARIRKVADASVILEHTHFEGLWFQAGSSIEDAPKVLLGMPCELVHQHGNPAEAGAGPTSARRA